MTTVNRRGHITLCARQDGPRYGPPCYEARNVKEVVTSAVAFIPHGDTHCEGVTTAHAALAWLTPLAL